MAKVILTTKSASDLKYNDKILIDNRIRRIERLVPQSENGRGIDSIDIHYTMYPQGQQVITFDIIDQVIVAEEEGVSKY